MLISNKYKFIFIHIPKTAGTTVRALLEPVADDITKFLGDEGEKITSNRIAKGLSPVGPHLNVVGISKLLNVQLAEYTLVSVMRDPFDRFVSYYNYLKFNNTNHRLHTAVRFLSLNQFVSFLIHDIGHDTACQYSFIRRPKEITIKNTFILRTEQLEEDYKSFCKELGVPIFPIKSLNKSERKTEERLTWDSKILISKFEREIGILYRF